LPLARLIVSITNTIATIRRFIRMFIQYVSILVSSPVVSSLLTIIFAPNQLTRMIDAYEVTIIIGDTVTMAFSALTKSL